MLIELLNKLMNIWQIVLLGILILHQPKPWCSTAWRQWGPERLGCRQTRYAAKRYPPSCTLPAQVWKCDGQRTAASSRWRSWCKIAQSCKYQEDSTFMKQLFWREKKEGSHLLTSKFSKPKMSNTPMEDRSPCFARKMAELILPTIHMNSRP